MQSESYSEMQTTVVVFEQKDAKQNVPQRKNPTKKQRHILQHSEASSLRSQVNNFKFLRSQMITKAYPQSLAAIFHQTGLVYKSVLFWCVLDRNTVCMCVNRWSSFIWSQPFFNTLFLSVKERKEQLSVGMGQLL